MGSSVKATCECGYEQPFQIGGGIATFRELCLFPCLCRNCKQIVGANLLQRPLACPECQSRNIVPYDQPELIEKEGSEVVASWGLKDDIGRELKLTNGFYYCPHCDTYRLRFTDFGILWD